MPDTKAISDQRSAVSTPGAENLTSLVRAEFMPLPTEHAATMRPASDFVHNTFESVELEAGCRRIEGRLMQAEGSQESEDRSQKETAVYGYYFDRSVFDESAARTWLAEKQVSVQKFERAKQDTYQGLSASGQRSAVSGQAICNLQFAISNLQCAVRAQGGAQKLPTFEILAYTGGPLNVEGFPYPVVVDVAGLELDPLQTPVLLDHEVSQPIGHGVPLKAGATVTIAGAMSVPGDAAEKVLSAAKNGFQWRASIGCEILDGRLVKAGETLQANGRTCEGPVIYAARARLGEVSIVSKGADRFSTVSIAARRKQSAVSDQRSASNPQSPIPNPLKAHIMTAFDWIRKFFAGNPTLKAEMAASTAGACAEIARQCAEQCRAAAADMTAEQCIQTAALCDATADLCRGCDMLECQAAADSCRACAELCRVGPSDETKTACEACAAMCEACATACAAAVQAAESAATAAAAAAGSTDGEETQTTVQSQAKPATLRAAAIPGVRSMSDHQDAVKKLREEMAAETQRIAGIRNLFAKYRAGWSGHLPEDLGKRVDELELKATGDAWSVDKAELELLRQGRPTPPAMRNTSGYEQLNGRVMEAAAARMGMLKNVEKFYEPQVLEEADRRYRSGCGLKRMLLEAAWAHGCPDRFVDDSSLENVLRHAFVKASGSDASTFSLPGILSNLANKFLLQGFYAVDDAWRRVAASQTLVDFKPHYSFRFYGDMTYEKVGATGELKHARNVGEVQYVTQADTYGKMFVTTRRDIINDDMGALSQLPMLLGMGAAYALNEVFWQMWLTGTRTTPGISGGAGGTKAPTVSAGSETIWSSDNANYLSGSTSVLGVTALSSAKQKFREQTKPDGKPLGIPPKYLLVPPALEDTARRLYSSAELMEAVLGLASTSSSTKELVPLDNPHKGMFEHIVCPYLAAAYTSLSGGSDTAWWLLADPAILPAAFVGFLNGQQTPTVQSSEADFNVLGIQHRGFFDFGCSMGDYRGAVKSAGA